MMPLCDDIVVLGSRGVVRKPSEDGSLMERNNTIDFSRIMTQDHGYTTSTFIHTCECLWTAAELTMEYTSEVDAHKHRIPIDQ